MTNPRHFFSITAVLLAISTCWVCSGHSQETKGRTKAVLTETQERIEQTKKADYKVLRNDREFIASMFDSKGRFLTEAEVDTPKWKFVRAIKKKDEKQPLQLIATAWYEARVTGKGVKKDETITYSALGDTIEGMVRLTIKSVPNEAKVYIREESNFVGNTEVKRWVMPGKIWIRLTLDNYRVCEKEIDVPGKNYTHTELLKKK